MLAGKFALPRHPRASASLTRPSFVRVQAGPDEMAKLAKVCCDEHRAQVRSSGSGAASRMRLDDELATTDPAYHLE